MTIMASWGGPLSNCYIPWTAANSFIMTSIVDASPWASATVPIQEAALIQATHDIDSRAYIGGRYYYDQLLQFPRVVRLTFPWNRTATSSTVFDITMRRMRIDVETSCCYQAVYILRHKGYNIHVERQALGIKELSEAVGPIKEQISYTGRHPQPLCTEALNQLHPWMTTKRIYRA